MQTPFKPWTWDNKATRAVYDMSGKIDLPRYDITPKDPVHVRAKNCMVIFHPDGSFYPINQQGQPMGQAYVIVPPSKYTSKAIMKDLKHHDIPLVDGPTQAALCALTPLRMRIKNLDEKIEIINKAWQHLAVAHSFVVSTPQFSILMTPSGDILFDIVHHGQYTKIWEKQCASSFNVEMVMGEMKSAIKAFLGDDIRVLSWKPHRGHPLLVHGRIGTLLPIRPLRLPQASAHEKMTICKHFPNLQNFL